MNVSLNRCHVTDITVMYTFGFHFSGKFSHEIFYVLFDIELEEL